MNNYPSLPKDRMTPRNCISCDRSFLPNKCGLHCTNGCCQDQECLNAYHSRRTPRTEHLRCIVCRKPAAEFESFAPCTKACVGTVYFQSNRSDPGTLGSGMFQRRFVSACHLRETWVPEWHKPDKPARKHVDYCSLRCYNSVAFGHETRRLDGSRLRARRRERQRGGEPAEPGWRNRWRQEQGYFKEYQRKRKLNQQRLLVYGDDRSDAELKSLDEARRLAAEDPDFAEIFGQEYKPPPLLS